MDWQDYILQVMQEYRTKNLEETVFPGTRIIEGLRDIFIADSKGEFALLWNQPKDSVERMRYIGGILEKMAEEEKIEKNKWGDYSLKSEN